MMWGKAQSGRLPAVYPLLCTTLRASLLGSRLLSSTMDSTSKITLNSNILLIHTNMTKLETFKLSLTLHTKICIRGAGTRRQED